MNYFSALDANPYICNRIANIKLTVLSPYKHFVAAFLLGLYAFIAAPVQLWHHHNSGFVKAGNTSKQTNVSTITKAGADTNCSVCSHKYSVYSDDTVPAPEFSVTPVGTTYNFFYPNIVTVAILAFFNKGPPVLS